MASESTVSGYCIWRAPATTSGSGVIICWCNIAWENNRHLATVPLVSPPNDVREMNAEIPYSWCVTTKIWVVLLIGVPRGKFDSTNHKHYPDLGSDAWSVWRWIIIHGMEFLRSFLRCHLAGKPVVASPNVNCFLRLIVTVLFPMVRNYRTTLIRQLQWF